MCDASGSAWVRARVIMGNQRRGVKWTGGESLLLFPEFRGGCGLLSSWQFSLLGVVHDLREGQQERL